MALDGPILLVFLSAAGLVLLAVSLLRLGRHSPPAMALAFFALLWAAQVTPVTAYVALDRRPAEALLLSQAFLIVLYIPLVQFVAVYPRRLRVADAPWWPFALVAPAVVHLALALALPNAGLNPTQNLAWGWATLLLPLPFLLGGMLAALTRFTSGYLRPRTPLEREQMFLGTLAFGSFVGYYEATLLLAFGDGVFMQRLGSAGGVAYAAIVGTALLVLGWNVARLFAGSSSRWLWAAAVGVPAASAIIANPATGNGIVGLWRLLAIGLLAYAVAKFQLFDLDVRLKRVARRAAPVALALLTWAALAEVAWTLGHVRWPEQAATFALLGALGLATGVVAGPALARRLDRLFPTMRATEEYEARRRMEVYLAACLGGATQERRDALARELRLARRERALLERHARPMPSTGGSPTIPERYRVDRVLAHGVFGELLLARDLRLDEPVVLKRFSGFAATSSAASFAREANVLGSLDHRHIIAVRDVFRDGDDFYVVMEHAEGGSLEDRLGSSPVPAGEALELVQEALSGLAVAHRRGVVHRDIKPANLLVRRGVVKLADFGIAVDPILDGAFRRVAGGPGTIAWMAPEQARGEPATPASDTYAVAAILYRMVAGRHYLPLERMDEDAARTAIAERSPASPIAGVPGPVNALLARGLAKDPESRFRDADEMLRAVRKARRHLRATAPAPGQAYGASQAS